MPEGEWIPVNKAETATIPAGSKATFEFEPDASGMHVDAVAASKFAGLTYEVIVDHDTRFGPTGVPPTDVDDLTTTHNPRMEVARKLTVIVKNPSSTSREVAAQVRGVER
jgi:hypothetical protein